MTTGDQAFLKKEVRGRWPEMTYAGALSFLRRRYSRELDNIDVAVTGIPSDTSVTFRPGCRLGPQAIRAASVQLAELKAFPFGFDPFEYLAVVDYGDCFIDPGYPGQLIDTIENHISSIIEKDVFSISLGGDHFTTYPNLKAHAKKHGPLALLQFDAHCDTWADEGDRLDHGTMFERGVREGIIDVDHSIQVGLRTMNDGDHGFEILTSPWVHRNGIDATVESIINRVKDKKVYMSVDIDVLDPAFAPGTGTPVCGGLASWQLLEIIRELDVIDVVGMDVVEVSPPFDHAEITAIAAATVVHDFIATLARRKGAKNTPYGKP